MQELAIKDLTENFFEAIGKEWMLVTSGSKEKFNTMTAINQIGECCIRSYGKSYDEIHKNANQRHTASYSRQCR